jgi:hypothetical protein
MIILKQTENTMSTTEEAALILSDIFDGDLVTQQAAIEEFSLFTDEDILDKEDALYDRYLPVREVSSIQE